MKKLLLFACAFALMLPAMAQTRVVNTGVLPQGNFLDFGGIYPQGGTVVPQDSLQVSDSIAYIIPLSHTNDIAPYYTWYWNKIGSGTATITLSFLQSNDNVNWQAVLKGQAQSTYTKSYTLSANTWSEVSFQRDTAFVMGRYLKVYFITSSTASVKGKIFNRLKANIK
jgi:hypothetical protein